MIGSDNKKHVLKRGERESHKNLKSTSVHSITREKCQTTSAIHIRDALSPFRLFLLIFNTYYNTYLDQQQHCLL